MKKRRNIFEIISSQRNSLEEINRIEKLLTDNKSVYIKDEFFSSIMEGTPTSIEEYIDDKLFKNWVSRGTCINTNDLKTVLGLYPIPTKEQLSEEYILKYCEYAANMAFLIKNKVHKQDRLTDTVDAIIDNIRLFLDWYNYDVKYFNDKENAIIVQKNATSTAVAEILNNDLSYSVVEYNHHLLKGDIEKKKSILLSLGSDLEPQRKNLKVLDKELEDYIFFLLNNLNIRHNNKKRGDKNYKEKVARMRVSSLEKWYDELYQLILSAYILLDNVDRKNRVKELKEKL